MARTKSKSELEAEIDDLNDYVEELESKLDNIAGVINEDDEDQDDDESEDDFEED